MHILYCKNTNLNQIGRHKPLSGQFIESSMGSEIQLHSKEPINNPKCFKLSLIILPAPQ